MPTKLPLILLLLIITTTAHAQPDQSPTLNIGDPAPPLRLRSWLKGSPVQQFEKGRIYVLEFWATWCRPCKAAMPHLSALADKYKESVTVIGIDIYEKQTTSLSKIKAFVDSMGQQMDYRVAAEDSNFMAVTWLDALGEPAIPQTIVINADGLLAWTGHPEMLKEVLPAIINNTWDIKEALAKKNLNRHLAEMDKEVQYELIPYMGDERYESGHPFKPDSALSAINKIITKEPGLKYTPIVASATFSALLNTDLQKAYEYGKQVIATPTYDEPAWDAIIYSVQHYSDKLKLPIEIYQLAAEASQMEIDHLLYPELVNLPRMYKNMAGFHWRANDKSKAIEALQKAIEILKSRKGFSAAEMAELNSRLEEYKKMYPKAF